VLIDWFTAVAQIINFLILVFLLKHFFYDRIIQAMEERENRIQKQLRDAEQREKDAEQEAESYRDKKIELERQRKEKLEQVKEEAEEQRKKLTQEVHKEVDNLRKKWKDGIQKEKEAFVRDLRRMAAREIFAIAREALGSLADLEVEERMTGVFLEQLKKLNENELKEMAQSLREENRPAVVRSGFEISAQMRRKITQAVHRHIADGVDVEYETVPELFMGIELKTRGRKLDWNLDAYLADLKESAMNLIESVDRAA
jgi:F-type H+-transporting ATPase subunit b